MEKHYESFLIQNTAATKELFKFVDAILAHSRCPAAAKESLKYVDLSHTIAADPTETLANSKVMLAQYGTCKRIFCQK